VSDTYFPNTVLNKIGQCEMVTFKVSKIKSCQQMVWLIGKIILNPKVTL